MHSQVRTQMTQIEQMTQIIRKSVVICQISVISVQIILLLRSILINLFRHYARNGVSRREYCNQKFQAAFPLPIIAGSLLHPDILQSSLYIRLTHLYGQNSGCE